MAIKTLLCPSCLKPMRSLTRRKSGQTPAATLSDLDTVVDFEAAAPPINQALRPSGMLPAAALVEPEGDTLTEIPAAPPPPLPTPPVPSPPPTPRLGKRTSTHSDDLGNGPTLETPAARVAATRPTLKTPAARIPPKTDKMSIQPLHKEEGHAQSERPIGTAPEVMIAHARQDITHTGLGFVRGVPTSMIGRGTELRRLMDIYKNVRESSQPCVVVLKGATGNGKTRIVFEFLESLRLSQYPFLLLNNFGASRSPEQRNTILQRIVASRFRLSRDLPNSARRKELLQRIRSVFSRETVAEATVVFGHLLGIRFPFSDTLAPLFRRIHEDPAYFEGLVRRLLDSMLKADADHRPILLWCDNFHDEDFDAQEAIRDIILASAGQPLLTLLAVEDDLPGDTQQTLTSHDNLDVHTLSLNELSRESCRELVHDILRLVDNLPNTIVDLIVEKSRGVPLVVEHMVRMLIDHGVIEQDETVWYAHPEKLEGAPHLPETIEELARARVANVTADERFVLQTAALMGSSFRLDDVLKLVSFMPFQDEVPWFDNRRESWLRDVILELLGRDIIVLVEDEDESAERFQFTYPIERSFVLESIEPQLAHWVHGCHARVLVERDGELDHIAWHFETAGMHSEAARYWCRLAEQEHEQGQITVAIDAYHRALSLMGPQDGLEFLDVLRDLSSLLMHIGNYPVAEQLLTQLLQCAYAFQNPDRSVIAYADRAKALFCLGALEDSQQSCQRALDLALRFNISGDIVPLCHERLGCAVLYLGDAGACADALRLLETALEMRRVAGDHRGIGHALLTIGEVRICRGEMNRALAAFTEAMALYRGLDSTLGLCRTLNAFATIHRKLKRYDLAYRHLQEALGLGGQQLDLITELGIHNNLGQLGIVRQDFGEAMSSLRRAQEISERTGNSALQAENACYWAQLYFSMEDFETAAEHAERAVIRARSGESRLLRGIALRELARAQSRQMRERVRGLSARAVRDIFLESLNLLEEMGNWHETAATLRDYGQFLIDRGKKREGARCFDRAVKLDPMTSQS